MDFLKYVESVLKSTDESYVGLSMNLRFDVIDFIKKGLKETGMTQGSFALKMKMKDSQLTRIMNAESNITLETVARIYYALGYRPTIKEKHEIPDAVSEDLTYSREVIVSQQNNYMIVNG